MRINRIAAEQAHAIPARAYYAPSIFAPEVAWRPRIVAGPSDVDDGGTTVPEGSTAQNGFKPVKWFRCNDCGGVVRETHLDSHECEV